MEDQFIKQNTDCVYFLASPFTCKKGGECEYRHSDVARLNPRDCWYWLSGNCLNPACAFRHPPLEMHTEAASKTSASLVSQPSLPATKSAVPCYFYFNGVCRKGDKCPFLHEPVQTQSSKPKITNTISKVTIKPLDTKTSGRSDLKTAPAKSNRSLFELAMKESVMFQVQQKQKQLVQEQQEACAPAEVLPISECEPVLDFDLSSEELIDGTFAPDEWYESSLGFDVLVDGKEEDMAYEDDPEYLCALSGGNDGDLEGALMQYDVDQNDYDERLIFRNELHNSPDLTHGSPRSGHTLERKVGRVSLKRRLLSVEIPVGSCNDMDLRDFLRQRRMVDGYLETRRRSGLARRRSDEKVHRRALNQRLHGRLASKVVKKGVGLARGRTLAVETHQRGKHRNSLLYKPQGFINGARRPRLANEGKRKSSVVRRERDTSVSITFDGPKSLDEIKKERSKGCSIGNGSLDFVGPKPFSEILQNKKQTTSTGNGEFSGSI